MHIVTRGLAAYLAVHELELRVRSRSLGRRTTATLVRVQWSAIGQNEWAMEADDLDGAIDSAVEAHRAWTRKAS